MDENSNSMFTCALPLANCQTQVVQVHFRGKKNTVRPEFSFSSNFWLVPPPLTGIQILRRNKFLFAAMQRLHFNNK